MFKSLIPMYIRDANIIIVVYDITVKESFTNTSHWVNETKDLKKEDAIFVLVGNKIDLETNRQVSIKEAEELAKQNDFLFFEVSAKTGVNVHELFNNNIFPAMAKKFNIVGDEEGGEENKNEEGKNNNVKLGEEKVKKEKKGCCAGKKGKKKDNKE